MSNRHCGLSEVARSTAVVVVVALSFAISPFVPAQTSTGDAEKQCSASALIDQGVAAYRDGRYEEAVALTTRGLGECEAAIPVTDAAHLRLVQADALIASGRYAEAAVTAQSALNVLSGEDAPGLKASLLADAGTALLAIDRLDEADQALQDGLALAKRLQDRGSEAALLNVTGTLRVRQKATDEALRAFQESASLAAQTGDHALAARAWINAAGAALQTSEFTQADEFLKSALAAARQVENDRDQSMLLAATGYRLQLSARKNDQAPVSERAAKMQEAAAALNESMELAQRTGNMLAQSYALGYLAELYESLGRGEDALNFARRGLYAAEQAARPDLEFRWDWLIARVLRAQGDMDHAADAYRSAIHILQTIRPELRHAGMFADEDFAARASTVFLEFADFLLRRYADPAYTGEREPLLVEARQTVELIKAVELEDFFEDDCVAALKSRTAGIDKLASDTAVLYPILFSDRIELLLTLPEGIQRFMVPIAKADFAGIVNHFRKTLEKRTTREYMEYAQELYDLIIKPAEPDLRSRQIHTLVIIPDDILRTVPLAALHDGSHFLIESYAVAVTPGLTLTDPQPIERRDVQVLLSGVTKPTQGFAPLPYVDEELTDIAAEFHSTVLKDEGFQVQAFRDALNRSRFGIVHVASHAQFGRDASHTFLLAYDGKMSIDKLEQFMGSTKFSDQPVELLTLSACQTAAGDERAALGLAGIAVKAGARSALASLWFINDPASAELIGGFYKSLRDPAVSKAEALRQAQLHLLADKRYRHPGYWSPFILIGNWL